ncbi:hypothetical protein Q7C36_016035 [Tachysurus vachellii]|uniref:Uncharacterized protein n=1 Tax=Tachysurus vachellii TaxID=175792 RepID=A0AA88M9F5_TACVA|nr:hypothetical protein Q7C36_016035 [Tachysurus vachellii]
MTDSERIFLRSAINEVLPDLSEVTKDILEELCQTLETSSSSVGSSLGYPTTLQSFSPSSSQSFSSSSSHSPDIDWVDTFLIPCEKFPEELMQVLEREKRPSPRLRREMVRIVVTEMMRKGSAQSRRHSTEVAKKMVSKYPISLQDVIDGDVVWPGYHSLVKQLQYRIENAKRSTTPKSRKRKHHVNESDTDEIPPEQRPTIQDTYRCINWDVKFMPLRETPESHQEKKENLKMMSYLLEEWPFWFNELGMAVHFKELTGIGLQETFTRNLDLKVTKFEVMRGELIGCSEDVKQIWLLLLSYFNEKEDAMFCYLEDTCLAGEVEMNHVYLTPTIVMCGQSCFSSKRFMLCVDRNIVLENITSFITALCMMFASYYCFNIHYPSELASTLEFLQRYMGFFLHQPGEGHQQTNKQTNTAHLLVNPRVLTLIQELSDHEWRDV